MKKVWLFFLIGFLITGMDLFCLPYIPGCPLHDSCVRALRAEQRARRRANKNRDGAGLAMTAAHNINLGLIAGFDDLADAERVPAFTLKPTLAYFGNFGSFDLYLGAFYTFFFEDPLVRKGGLQETFGYNFLLGDSTTLTITLDNDNQFNFTRDKNIQVDSDFYCMFANLEPSLTLTQDLTYGDISVAIGVPLDYSEYVNKHLIEDFGDPQLAMDGYITLGYNTSFGLGIQVSPRMWIKPEVEYGETELTLTWGNQSFYTSLTLSADDTFKEWSIEPYIAYTYKNWMFTATVVFDGIGSTGTGNDLVDAESGAGKMTITPSIGIKYRFQPGSKGRALAPQEAAGLFEEDI
jgi:hypothetical protein